VSIWGVVQCVCVVVDLVVWDKDSYYRDRVLIGDGVCR